MAAEGNFNVFDDGIGGKLEEISEVDAGLEFNIVDGACVFVVEMAVFVKVWTITGGLAVEIDLSDDFVLHECFKAVVDRSKRDIRKGFLDAHENFVCGGVDALSHQKTVDFFALAGHAEGVDFLRDVRDLGFCVLGCHRAAN